MMKLNSKYVVEGIIVIFVIVILLYLSIPRFIKTQKIFNISNVEMLVKSMRNYCLDDRGGVDAFRKHYSRSLTTNLWGPIYNSNNQIKANIYVKNHLIEVNAEKWVREFEGIQCDPEILNGYKFFLYAAYQKKDSSPLPIGEGYQTYPYYFSFSASNNPMATDLDADVIMDVNDLGYYNVIANDITPFDVTNGLNSIGGFTYDSQEAMPLPKATILDQNPGQ